MAMIPCALAPRSASLAAVALRNPCAEQCGNPTRDYVDFGALSASTKDGSAYSGSMSRLVRYEDYMLRFRVLCHVGTARHFC
jgi:hypothetical protein